MSRADSRLFTLANSPMTVERGLFNQDGQYDAMNEWVCKQIAEKLLQHYPGQPWGVVSEVEHGIAKIFLQGFTQWAVVIKLATMKSNPGLKTVVKYAGELLERLNLPRSGFDFGQYREALHRYPHHFFRNAKAPE